MGRRDTIKKGTGRLLSREQGEETKYEVSWKKVEKLKIREKADRSPFTENTSERL